MHVGRLVLDRLERSDRHPELVAAAHVVEDQVQNALARTDHRHRHAHQGDVMRPFGVDLDAGGIGHPQSAECQVGDVQDGVEHGAASPGKLPARFIGVDDEHRGIGHHRQPLGAIAVQYVPRGAVQHPLLAVAVNGDPAVDGGAGCLGVKPVGGQRRKLGHGRQKRGGISGASQLFEHDGQLDGGLGLVHLGPAVLYVGLPDRGRVDAVFGDTSDQRGRALLAHGVAHGFLPEPLISVEFQQHPGQLLRSVNVL